MKKKEESVFGKTETIERNIRNRIKQYEKAIKINEAFLEQAKEDLKNQKNDNHFDYGNNWFVEGLAMPCPNEIIIAVNDIRGTTIKKDDIVFYIGEISNMRGHIAVADREGKVWFGYHPENFRRMKEDEI